MRLPGTIWSCKQDRKGGPPLIEAGPVNKGRGADLRPRLELLKNEMKIRGEKGARDPHRNSNQKTASKNEAVNLSLLED